jgi:hypothetical protein
VKLIAALIQRQERRRFHIYVVLLFCIFVGLARALLEQVLFRTEIRNSEALTFIPFYISIGTFLTLGLSRLSRCRWQDTYKAMLVGIFLGLFPPLVDLLLGTEAPFYGYYILWNAQHIPWTAWAPEYNYPPGEGIVVWSSILFCGIYVWVKTSSPLRSLAGILWAYFIFLLQGIFLPMLIVRLTSGTLEQLDQMSGRFLTLQQSLYYLSIAQLFLGSIAWLLMQPALLTHLRKRILHPLPFLSVCYLGVVLSGAGLQSTITSMAALAMVAAATIMQNDHYDYREKGAKPPVSIHDVLFFNITAVGISLLLLMAGERSSIVLLLLFSVSVLYNSPMYRAKRTWPANLKIEGVWGAGSFLTGYIGIATTSISTIHLWILFLVFGGWSLFSAFKDYKDLLDDRHNGISSLYLVLYNRGIPIRQTHKILKYMAVVLFFLPLLWTGMAGENSLAIYLLAAAYLILCFHLLFAHTSRKKWFAGMLVLQTIYVLLFAWCLGSGQQL